MGIGKLYQPIKDCISKEDEWVRIDSEFFFLIANCECADEGGGAASSCRGSCVPCGTQDHAYMYFQHQGPHHSGLHCRSWHSKGIVLGDCFRASSPRRIQYASRATRMLQVLCLSSRIERCRLGQKLCYALRCLFSALGLAELDVSRSAC